MPRGLTFAAGQRTSDRPPLHEQPRSRGTRKRSLSEQPSTSKLRSHPLGSIRVREG
jgi:hypothetical protein